MKSHQINIKQHFSNSNMQRNLSAVMYDSTNSNTSTPEQKLRKISFDATQLNQFLNNIPNLESQNVEGWGNQTWNLKNNTFHMGKTLQRPFLRGQGNKNTQSPKKSPILREPSNDRTKYIQKLEEQLTQLVNIKKERQTIKVPSQNPSPHYLTPRKQTTTAQRTTSTSQSESQLYEHNFTSISMRKYKQKSPLLKIKKVSKQLIPDKSFTNQPQLSEQVIKTRRLSLNRSMLTSYEPFNQKSKQISIISYPVLDSERKPRHRKLSKLQDLKETFYLRHNPEQSKNLFNKQMIAKRQNSLFKIKISEPKINEQSRRKLKI